MLTTTTHHETTGHAVAFLSYETIEDLLELPKGVRIRGATQQDTLRRGLNFLLEGKPLPYCPEGTEPERMDLIGHIAYIDEDKRRYYKVSLALPREE